MAQHNCKVGDLAITVTAQWPDNVGNIVEIIELAAADEAGSLAEEFGLVWRVRTVGKAVLHYRYPQEDGTFLHDLTREGPVPDRFLKPITPPEQTLDEAHVLELLA